MSIPKQCPIKVLLFSSEPSLGGGVAAFDELFRRKLSASIQAEQFLAGRRPGFLGRTFRAVVPFYDAIRLAWLLTVRRHDVYHLNPSLVPRAIIRDGLFLLVLRLFRRRQVLVFIRGWDAKFYEQIARSRSFRFLFRSVYGLATRVLVLASGFPENLAALGVQRNRVHTISTMFDGDLFRDVTRKREDDMVVVVFLARFVAAKGIYQLLEGFRQASLRSPNIVLIMAGDGPEAQAARDWCARKNLQHRVRFPGHVEGTEKAQLLMDADIFVLPSYHGEGCPNALLEAMGAGLPVIVTPVGGIPDVVQNGVNGLVIGTRDSDAVAVAIKHLADHASLRSEMGKRNRAEAWQRYEANSVTQLLEAHYCAIVRRSGTLAET